MYYVYVLKSKNNEKSYVGLTEDLDKRIKEHNDGKSSYTSRYVPWILIHKEEFENLKEAREREIFLKTTSGRRLLKKIFFKL